MFILCLCCFSLSRHHRSASLGVPASFFTPFRRLSKFFIILAMAAIGLNSNVIKLVKAAASRCCSARAAGRVSRVSAC